jgi:peptidyl-prolyl cis-trans isomerase A (cyclophilin A)
LFISIDKLNEKQPIRIIIISMARWQPGTATSEFFICVGNQPELDYGGKRNPDEQGFAAFGKVIDGMDVVKKIHSQPAEGQYLNPVIPILEISLIE